MKVIIAIFLSLLQLNVFAQVQPPTKEWDKAFGGNGVEDLYSLQQTSDGGYILGGFSTSGISGDKSENYRGYYDYWIVKVDSSGVKQWDKTFGGSG
ncbi:MAG TPA: hypothetical protein PLP23_06585 [Panacibacter sp.]|nr:hypothetical protein [Panacibacter sp.]